MLIIVTCQALKYFNLHTDIQPAKHNRYLQQSKKCNVAQTIIVISESLNKNYIRIYALGIGLPLT